MKCKDIKLVNNGLFDKMKNSGYEESYIIDSNILLTLRDLFYNPSKQTYEEIDSWLAFVQFLKDKNIIVTAALQEVAWDYENLKIDEVKFNRCSEAISELLFNQNVIERIRMKRAYSGMHSSRNGKKRKLTNIYENSMKNNYIVPTMCVFLKLQELLLRYDVEKEPENIYMKICEFMGDKLGLVGSYELILIQLILFSSDNNIKREIKGLLKLDSKNNFKKDFKKSLWNASWDVSFMRSITALSVNSLRGETVNGIHNPILVTGDNNLYKCTSFFISNMKFKNLNGKIYPVLKSSNVEEKYSIYIEAAWMAIEATKKERLYRHNSVSQEQRMEEFKQIIRDTEHKINQIINK